MEHILPIVTSGHDQMPILKFRFFGQISCRGPLVAVKWTLKSVKSALNCCEKGQKRFSQPFCFARKGLRKGFSRISPAKKSAKRREKPLFQPLERKISNFQKLPTDSSGGENSKNAMYIGPKQLFGRWGIQWTLIPFPFQGVFFGGVYTQRLERRTSGVTWDGYGQVVLPKPPCLPW